MLQCGGVQFCEVRAAQAQARPTLTLDAMSHAKTQPEAGSFPHNDDPDSRSNPLRQDLMAPKMRSMTQGQVPRRGILAQQISQPKNCLSITQQLALIHATVALTRHQQ